MKLCRDKQCRRLGQQLPQSEFPRNRRASDGRYLYCRDCCRRRERARRAAKGAREYRPRDISESVSRKPMVVADGMAFSVVYDAIKSGLKTREQIHRETGVDYDTIGEVLTELIFDCKAVRIRDREFHLAA